MAREYRLSWQRKNRVQHSRRYESKERAEKRFWLLWEDKTIVLVRLEWRKVSDWRITQGASRCKAKGGRVGSAR